MDFAFTEEQEQLRKTVRQFAREVLLPKYAHWDKTGESALVQRRKMGEIGLTGLLVPEKYGGTPSSFVTCGVVAEEIARGDFSCAAIMTQSWATSDLLTRFASEEVKERYLPPLARGELSFACAVTEPQCGSDAGALSTVAVRDGDHYVITGEKSSASMAGQVEASIIFCKTDPSRGPRGISAIVVPSDTPGLSTSNFHDIGLRAYKRGSFHLDGVRVPVSYRLGEEGRALSIVLNLFAYTRALMALMSIGLAQQTMEETIEFVKTRTAFGQPVARYQGVAFPIVEKATLLEAARLLSYKCLWLRDQNLPHHKETAMAKWWVPQLCFETVHQLLLCYGHSGYSDDYPVGQRMRDVLGYQIGEGTPQIMKLLVAREIFGQELAPN